MYQVTLKRMLKLNRRRKPVFLSSAGASPAAHFSEVFVVAEAELLDQWAVLYSDCILTTFWGYWYSSTWTLTLPLSTRPLRYVAVSISEDQPIVCHAAHWPGLLSHPTTSIALTPFSSDPPRRRAVSQITWHSADWHDSLVAHGVGVGLLLIAAPAVHAALLVTRPT